MRRIHNQSNEEGFALMLVLWTSAILAVFLLVLTERVHTGYQITRMNRDHLPLKLNARNGFYRMAESLTKRNKLVDGFDQKDKPFKGLFKIDLESWKIQWISNIIEGDLKRDDDELSLYIFVSVLDSKFPIVGISRDVLSKVEGLEGEVLEQILNLNLNSIPKKGSKAKKSISNDTSLYDVFYHVKSDNAVWFNGPKESEIKSKIENDKTSFKNLFTKYSDGKIYIGDASWEVLRLIPGVDDVTAREVENAFKQGRPIKKAEDFKQVFGISKTSLKGLKKMVKFKPAFFEIIVIAQKGDFHKKVSGIIELTKKGFNVRVLR